MELADDMKTCLKIFHSIYNTPQRDNPSPLNVVKYAQMVCPDGFTLENETCLGIIQIVFFFGLVELLICFNQRYR